MKQEESQHRYRYRMRCKHRDKKTNECLLPYQVEGSKCISNEGWCERMNIYDTKILNYEIRNQKKRIY